MSSNRNTSKAILIVIGVLLLIGSGIFVALSIENYLAAKPDNAGQALSRTELDKANKDRNDVLTKNKAAETIDYNGATYKYNDNIDVLLFAGIDDREVEDYTSDDGPNRNEAQADFLIVAIFDNDKKTYTLLQINRDTMVDMMDYDYYGTYNGLINNQIALSHTYRSGMEDSAEDTVFAVSHFLYGVGIDDYFCITMDAIPVINDSVGGVTVKVKDDFSAIDTTLIKDKTIRLNGTQAENYVRGRMSVRNDPTNINRMSRQSEFMSALLPELGKRSASDSTFAVDLFNKVNPYMVTDCKADDVSKYAEKFSGYTLDKIVTPEGRSVEGEKFMEFYADEASLKSIVIDLFYVKQ